MIPVVVNIKNLEKYKIWVKFSDFTEGEYDLSHLAGKGIFKKWDENNLFEKVHIDNETGAIAWNENIDICSDSVYMKLKGMEFDKINIKNA